MEPREREFVARLHQLAYEVLDGAEEGVHGCAGRIVDGEQQGEARAASSSCSSQA